MENGNHVLVQFAKQVASEERTLVASGFDGDPFIEALRRAVRRYSEDVDPHEQSILEKLRELGRNGKKLVSTLALATEFGVSESTMWRNLNSLEDRLLVSRPKGTKSGWTIIP